MPFDYEIHLRVQAARPVLFERLLRIEHLARWFCGWARIEAKVGGQFQFGGETCIFLPEGRGWNTKIDEGESLRTFAFLWPIQGSATRVSYELEDAGESACRLVARHRGVPVRETTCGSVQDAWRMCLGNLKSIAEGRGDSVRPEHAPPTPGELRVTALIEVEPSRVFQALTEPAQVDHWSTGGVPTGRAKVEASPGGAYALGLPDGPDRILAIEQDRRLVLRWARDRTDLRIVLDLEEKASGTAVYVTATGYPEDTRQIVHDRGRWSDWLVSLKNLVEAGDAGFANPYDAQVWET